MKSVLNFLKKNEWVVIGILLIVFVLIRLPGTGSPLHQDEYKWPMLVNPANTEGSIPHPPLGEFIYRTAGYIVGFNVHFRFVPLFFGSVNLLLLYYFLRFLLGRKEALVGSLIWIFSYFSVLASLMVDTDGEVMPFFFLIALICYYKLKSTGADPSSGVRNKKWIWSIMFIASLICGLLVKLSFAIAVGAFICDFLWARRHIMAKKDLVRYGLYALLAVGIFSTILTVAHYLFPFFDLKNSLSYWEHFIVFDRGWFQTFIQCSKALLYTSPFLLLIPLVGSKEIFSKTAVLGFFLIIAFIFYIILFDFSLGALDRYLQLLILPLTVFSSAVVVDTFKARDKHFLDFVLIGFILGLVLVLLQFLPHYVPSLHPKSEWVSRIFSLRWNFVYPFSGGSGPLGFYVSFLFIGLMWLFSIILAGTAFFRTGWKTACLALLIPLGIAYNAVFIEEYLVGYWNGSASRLLSSAIVYIRDNPDIQKVTVYNDNGGNEIQQIGKYRKRLYTDPKFDISEKIATLNTYKEHYFVLDVPRIDPQSVYQKYLDSCKIIYKKTDQKMSAVIYDCRNVSDILK